MGDAEMLRLAQAHRDLLDARIKAEVPPAAQFSRRQKIETFLSNKGILSVIGIFVAIVLGVLKIWLG